ncbi:MULTISPECIES: hypothetical protein [unclassified Janthinobacterium]|uniref:hypothetical protein n=1 Tax=unclassified Janthinobacterium TaxID=2610881 RepID=UPI0017F4D63B|nr:MULTISPECIES: hypothetical protein [unclassified Janthinobacterium]MBB5368957.1 hypothetical protein [Janthinobacterium sp. K2C7]MBB5381507.1 hypothetical protein [Janthinobacterium sp. K2Li3]MBB5387339.1 hypothetical protein [Janthinobacterium sp. K2E3]
MQTPGPHLETLTHRLADTPVEFLAEPRIAGVVNAQAVSVAALVNDILLLHGARAPAASLQGFLGAQVKVDRNRLALAMIVCWLLAGEWFIAQRLEQPALLQVLGEAVRELAAATPAHQYTQDPERREELARIVLARLGFRPRDESLAQATDRLSAISGSERRRLLEASRLAEQRARGIREALAKKAAEESADKWSRE